MLVEGSSPVKASHLGVREIRRQLRLSRARIRAGGGWAAREDSMYWIEELDRALRLQKQRQIRGSFGIVRESVQVFGSISMRGSA